MINSLHCLFSMFPEWLCCNPPSTWQLCTSPAPLVHKQDNIESHLVVRQTGNGGFHSSWPLLACCVCEGYHIFRRIPDADDGSGDITLLIEFHISIFRYNHCHYDFVSLEIHLMDRYQRIITLTHCACCFPSTARI